MPLDIPVPSALPDDDISQYVPLLLSAVEEFLQLPDVWAEGDYDDGFQYMEALKQWIVRNIPHVTDIPIGMVATFADSAGGVPAKWLFCDGSAVSRTTYAALFAKIGTAFGGGNLTTTFNLPDYRDKFIRNAPDASNTRLGVTGGAATVTLSTAQIPSHSHVQQGFASGATTPAKSLGGNSTGGLSQLTATNTTGGGGSHENLPPFSTLYFGIFAGV